VIEIIERGPLSTDLIYNKKTVSINSIMEKDMLLIKISQEGQLISIRKKDNITLEEAEAQHRRTVEEIKGILTADNLGAYVQKACELIKIKRFNDALLLLREVRTFHPEEPYLMSIDGYLTALVEKRYRDGVTLCQEALRRYEKISVVGREFFLPFFYLNVAKTYLLSNNKRLAVENLFKILKIDNENPEALKELANLGIRKRPVIPFLKRSNPLNKYLGILRARLLRKGIEKDIK